MKLALISVSDKTNIIELCNFLLKKDYNIISTGGTYLHILKNLGQEKCRDRLISIDTFTGTPELLNGRVKTLNPIIYAGILYDPNIAEHRSDFEEYSNSNNVLYNLKKIDLVVVNLYPFENVVNNKLCSDDEIIENIDIGGVSLLRAAAKNYKNVLVLTHIEDYSKLINYYEMYDTLELFRKEFALKAFEHVTDYDAHITKYFDKRIRYRKYKEKELLKYGCNPYQDTALIASINNTTLPFEVVNGTPGYINYLDAFQSWLLVSELRQQLDYCVAASFKHTAPAGVGTSKLYMNTTESIIYDIKPELDIDSSASARAFIRARNSDALSSFGDFVAISDTVDETCAKLIKREVSDGIIAKDYTPEALKILSKKKKGKYIILKGNSNININNINNSIEYREIFGVALAQKVNTEKVDDSYFTNIPTLRNELPEHKKEDLILATTTLKYTPSNSIVVSNNYQVIGVGAGQQNRVDCIKIAGSKALTFNMRFHPKCIELIEKFKPEVKRQDKVNAIIKYIHNDFLDNELVRWRDLFTEPDTIELFTEKEKLIFQTDLTDLCLSSDGFFPFRDNIDYAQRYGVSYILNPGGSIQDDNVIEACDEYNILMAISGKRMFYH
jgi:phosphoribosylaminoimidazolecarboxamide formyltransferase/IMP cyclohydrolase